VVLRGMARPDLKRRPLLREFADDRFSDAGIERVGGAVGETGCDV